MQSSKLTATNIPKYLRLPRAQLFSAVFPGDQSISVESSRARRYPGLVAAAPDTRGLYALGAEALSGCARVLDLGCGSGIGTALLCDRFDEVTALDADLGSLCFVRNYLPEIKVWHEDGSAKPPPGKPHDGACIVDVLGQASDPLQPLRRLRRLLSRTGRVFIAEPRAYPVQSLLPPVQRAFSQPGLIELLSAVGFSASSWFDQAGHFVACVAQPSADDGWMWLEQADTALAGGQEDAALRGYARLAQSELAPPQRVWGLLRAARLHSDRGRLDAACQHWLEAANLCPQNVPALVGLAELSLRSGELTQALELAIRALERDPCDVGAVRILARAGESLGQHDALATWRIANALDPSDLETAIELSRLAAGAGEFAYAIWVLERLRDFKHDLAADFHVTLSWLYLSTDRAGDARLEAQIARVKDPASSGVSELCAHLDSLASAA
jgi:tetratricopeptide (TPR) repeat protein